MIVELDVFSGRPNPRWRLDDEARTTFHRLMAGLGPAAAPAATPPGLGYRGFVVEDGDQTYRIFGGLVATGDSVLADSARTLERWLLAGLPERYEALRPTVVRTMADG
ncbi:hypothetical protein [Streptomyces purpurascens]|uniref:Uncharacterized protein n=1 Tax=Streptomyces purpurascens TaxID=1924 RepID=A0ABZ1MUE1_STREF|nr:hypothetical protein [Streptomyces purpurascens]MCE7045865.1 hypothetical protein [Streptomyces purpurascens]GGZ96993.1 hypothetical protein GCM10010303_02020 [Streptomyces purpurascens]